MRNGAAHPVVHRDSVELAHDYPNYWIKEGWVQESNREPVRQAVKRKAEEACGRVGRRPGKVDRIRPGQCYQHRNVAFVGWACDSGQILVRISCE